MALGAILVPHERNTSSQPRAKSPPDTSPLEKVYDPHSRDKVAPRLLLFSLGNIPHQIFPRYN